jgi:hypothetical protein
MAIDAPPNPQVSLQTVLGAVKRQSQEIEAKFDHVQSSWPCRAEWYFHGRQENT